MQLLLSALDRYVAPLVKDGLVLAISGGPDSRALLESMACWRLRLNARILVVSINHGMREQARLESYFTLMRARRLGFKTHSAELLNNNLGEQELRQRRYSILAQACSIIKTPYICTAHHQDDNAEGFLMSLFGIGGGAQGAAMGVYEPMGAHTLVRPFVGLSKKNLMLALSLYNHTDFALDNLDQDRVGQRAWLRHEVIPALVKHEADINERLDYFARQERHKKTILQDMAENIISYSEHEALIRLESNPEPYVIELAARSILRKWYKDRDLRQAKSTIATMAGLDRYSQASIVNDLRTKEFALPGAVAYSNGKEIVIKRV
jgi:tRNA(Ile)-lysidine synthase